MTPMMAQYRKMKENYPDAILFFRLGDFYEMFFEDAIEASRLLQITLTSRNKGDHKAPMCGVPYHAANSYIAKLTRLGKKVAICEQLSDPNLPGIVERDVVRVITPGTTLDDQLLDQKSNNYLVAIAAQQPDAGHGLDPQSDPDGGPDERQTSFGLACCDVSTGELRVTFLANTEELQTELEKIRPVEAILEHRLLNEKFFQQLAESNIGTFFFPHDFHHEGESFLKDFFNLHTLDSFGLKDQLSRQAAAMLLHYLQTTQKANVQHIRGIHVYKLSEFMPLDEHTLKNLELITTLRENKKEGSLLWVLDQTVTSMGGRFLRFSLLHPLCELTHIEARLDALEELTVNPTILEDIREVLKHILDLERLLARLSLGHGNARDLVGLKNSLKAIPYLQSILAGLHTPLLKEISGDLDALPELAQLIETAMVDEPPLAVKEGGIIKEGFHAELDQLKTISRDGKNFIQQLQQREVERTGINSLKIRYNSVFGYYIEVSKTNLHAVPQDYIRKQTLVNAERFITPELKEYEEKVLGAEEKIVALEYELFDQVRQKVLAGMGRIQNLAHAIAQLDMLCSLAKVAIEQRYCKPIIKENGMLRIEAGRHPVVEKMSFSGKFVPNDATFDDAGQTIHLITGPNMGGKSTFLRQTALIVLMAHIGSFIPASKAEISLVDRIFTRVGASDNLIRGQSTFMVEMQETAYILHHATAKSLIILDEIGRGTSTYDGMSIAWALLEFIHDHIGAKTLFATHYHELIALAEKLPHAANYSVAVKENEQEGVVFLYKVLPGGVDRSYGIEVAKLAGLPHDVITKARQILVDLEEGVLESGIRKELLGSGKSGASMSIPDTQTLDYGARAMENHPELPERPQQSIRQHPALEEFRQLDVNSLTPLEALNILNGLKKKLD